MGNSISSKRLAGFISFSYHPIDGRAVAVIPLDAIAPHTELRSNVVDS